MTYRRLPSDPVPNLRFAWSGIWILLIAAFGACSTVLVLDYSPDEMEPLTDSEREKALAIILGSEYFAKFVGTNGWSLDYVGRGVFPSGIETHGVIFALSERLDSDGPWLYLICQGTRSIDLVERLRGITHISARVSPHGELIEFRPAMADALLPHEPHDIRCPFGLEPPSNN